MGFSSLAPSQSQSEETEFVAEATLAKVADEDMHYVVVPLNRKNKAAKEYGKRQKGRGRNAREYQDCTARAFESMQALHSLAQSRVMQRGEEEPPRSAALVWQDAQRAKTIGDEWMCTRAALARDRAEIFRRRDGRATAGGK